MNICAIVGWFNFMNTHNHEKWINRADINKNRFWLFDRQIKSFSRAIFRRKLTTNRNMRCVIIGKISVYTVNVEAVFILSYIIFCALARWHEQFMCALAIKLCMSHRKYASWLSNYDFAERTITNCFSYVNKTSKKYRGAKCFCCHHLCVAVVTLGCRTKL